MTDSMRQAIGETSRRRAKQEAYNREHNITPQSIIKSVDMQLAAIVEADYVNVLADDAALGEISTEGQLQQVIVQMESQMREAAKKFEFERAAALRDRIRLLKQRDLGVIASTPLFDSVAPPAPDAANSQPLDPAVSPAPAPSEAAAAAVAAVPPTASAPDSQLDSAAASASVETPAPSRRRKRAGK